MNMQSIGEKIVRGLSVGCGLLILVQCYFWFTFQSRRPAEIDTLYETTNDFLWVSGLILLFTSLAIIYDSPKLSALGAIIAVLTILAAFNSPLYVIRA
jgi:hypothetical protein